MTALQPYSFSQRLSFSQLLTAVRRLWLLTVGDARTVDAGSARDLLLAYLILGGDVDWRSSLFASGCTARLGAGNGQGMLTHVRTFLFDGRLLFGERDDFSSPRMICSVPLPCLCLVVE